MINNCHYDLIETISVISKSLARYDTYMKDCSGHESCRRIWTMIKNHREEELKMLLGELKSAVEAGEITVEEQEPVA